MEFTFSTGIGKRSDGDSSSSWLELVIQRGTSMLCDSISGVFAHEFKD